MGLVSLWKSSRGDGDGFDSELYEKLSIDLTSFSCGDTKLGERISRKDFFYIPLKDSDLFESKDYGVILETDNNLLNSIQIDVDNFPGKLHTADGARLSKSSTVKDVVNIFGKAYWQDEDSDEIILFYEVNGVELQLEFPDKQRLGYLSILSEPIMADSQNRKQYGVNKPWPPES